MPAVKLDRKKPIKRKKQTLTRLEKAELRSQQILKNDQKQEKERKAKAWLTYVEHKILKGHSREQSEAMANEIIYNQKPV